MPPADFIPTTIPQWGLLGVFLTAVVWVIYAVMRGILVPRRTVDDIRKDRDERLAQSLEIIKIWKETAEERQKAISELKPMIEEIVDNHATILKILSEVRDSRRGGVSRGH